MKTISAAILAMSLIAPIPVSAGCDCATHGMKFEFIPITPSAMMADLGSIWR